MRSSLALLAMCVFGCAEAVEPEPVDVEPAAVSAIALDATLYVQASPYPGAIVRAADAWRDATSGRANLAVMLGDGPAPAGTYPIVPAGPELGAVLGNCRPDAIRLRYDAIAWGDNPEGLAAVVVAHELGHAFGLPHLPEGLMRSYANPEDQHLEIDAATRDAFCQLWGCPAQDSP